MNEIERLNQEINHITWNSGVQNSIGIGSELYAIAYVDKKQDTNYLVQLIKSTEIKKLAIKIIDEIAREFRLPFGGKFEIEMLQEKAIYEIVKKFHESKLNTEEVRVAYNKFIEGFIINSGKRGENFATPGSINKLQINILNPTSGELYDGAAGIGGSLVTAKEFNLELEVFGQELSEYTAKICKIRLLINGINPDNLLVSNTLTDPIIDNDGNTIKKFDYITMDFPFRLDWRDIEQKVINDKYGRFAYGLPSKVDAGLLIAQLIIKGLKENGKATMVTTLGTLFRSPDARIRENIIRTDFIEAVITLPSGLYSSASIPVALIVFNKDKKEELRNKILFINAASMYEKLNRTQNVIDEKNLQRILTIYNDTLEVEEISTVVSIDELIEGSNLLPDRYVIKTIMDSDIYGEIKFKKDKLNELNGGKTLGDICKSFRGINITPDVETDVNGEYKIVNISDVRDGSLNINDLTRYTIKNNARIEQYTLESGDLIISNKGTNTKICVIPEIDEKILMSQNFIGLRFKSQYLAEYIKAYLESPLGQYYISNKQAGTNIISLLAKDLLQIPIIDLDKNMQEQILNEYKTREQHLKNEIIKLETELRVAQNDMYDKMGILDTFVKKF